MRADSATAELTEPSSMPANAAATMAADDRQLRRLRLLE